jgi:hypothetical protein
MTVRRLRLAALAKAGYSAPVQKLPQAIKSIDKQGYSRETIQALASLQ